MAVLCACAGVDPARQSEAFRARQAAWERPALEAELRRTQDLPMQQTASGLRYQVLRAGEGEPPAPDSFVALDYRVLSRADGTSGLNTHHRGFPESGPLDAFPPAVREGIALMPAGAQYRLFLPASPAAADADQPVDLRAATIADIELLLVLPSRPPAPGQASGPLGRDYLQRVNSLLIEQVRYPNASKGMGEEGTCRIRVAFAGDGRLLRIDLVQGSGFERLDQACLGAVYEMRRFPPVPGQPAANSFEITTPISFSLDPHPEPPAR